MKILYIITQGHGGGAQKYTLALAKHFGGMIAAGLEDSELFRAAQLAGVQTFQLSHLKRDINLAEDFLAMLEIRQLIKNLGIDVVHLNSSKAGVLGSFAAIGLKKKIIFTAHGFIFNEPLGFARKTFYLALEKIASDYRDFIITVSDADKQSALDNNLISAEKIQTIHNGINQIDFLSAETARSTLTLPNDKFLIGCVANAYKTKGLDVLIDAVSLMSDESKNKIQIAIIGDGPEIENLKLKIENLRLSSVVKLLGKVDRAEIYLRAFNLFILPSRKEGFPYTLLEAMQAGLPIIATNVGGNPEALGDAAVLVPSENPKTLANAIITLVSDSAKQKTLSQKTQERAKIFTEAKMLEQTNEIYQRLIKK